MKVAYMGCEGTLTTSVNRRIDAHEHDSEFLVLQEVFAHHGDELIPLSFGSLLIGFILCGFGLNAYDFACYCIHLYFFDAFLY